jgi:uncharacterized surface protein with fasciclin (FAS1) repeats
MLKTAAAAVLAIAAFGTAACSSSTPSPITPSMTNAASTADRSGTGRATEPTIAQIAIGNPAFSTLVSALVKAGLAETFNGRPNYTVFAPTNDAFDAAARAFGLADGPALVAALDVRTLTSVLTYHVTNGSRISTSVVAAGQLQMLDGNTARVTVEGGTARIENAAIVATDIRASNGYVHVIDAVLLPPSLRK